MREVYALEVCEMSLKGKKTLTKTVSAIFAVLLILGGTVFIYAHSPLNPANISDKTVIEKGAEYKIKLKGVSEYDENGFRLVTEGFYFTDEKLFVCVDGDGYARTTDDGKGENYLLGKCNSADISYAKYEFCGKEYRNIQELEAFFEIPDPIYNFDINDLSYYISDIINYKKQFFGTATIRLYKGRCVITSVSIGDEKVLEIKL